MAAVQAQEQGEQRAKIREWLEGVSLIRAAGSIFEAQVASPSR